MKIKVITRHAPSNYGSLLQSIATIKVIEGMGHDCEIIDYQRPDERGLSRVLSLLSQKEGYGNPIKRMAYIALRYPIEKYAQMKFDFMRKKYLKMTVRCSNHEDLKYWCPVNLYGRPYKRRVLGKRIEGVASDGMPWKKNPTAWKKVPTAACFYGAPHRRK